MGLALGGFVEGVEWRMPEAECQMQSARGSGSQGIWIWKYGNPRLPLGRETVERRRH
jgi:hypothetical protein